LGLNGQEIIELNTVPAGSGRIKISTITPDEYPWTGIYFDGCPVQITAIPNPGYEFSHWMPNAIWDENNQNVSVLENVGQYTQFIAVFEGVAVDAEIRISELNYHSHLSHDSGDWIELHNNSEVEVDLSDWVVSDIYATMSFTIPMGTVIPANEYLVLVANEAKFTSQYSITNFIGQLDFDLDNGGEYLVLKDHFGNVALELTYNDNSSWPQGCDGFGRTLEKEDNNVYNDPEGWYDGCMFGSPGEAFSPCTDALVISEIHYHPQDELNPGDWLEIVNLSSETLDISGWIFSDSNPLNDYVIDDNTSLESGQRLILAQSPEMFNEIYACYGDVEVQGPFNFGLSNSGEMLTLNTNDALLAYSCYYDDAAGWPQSPDGDGPSLELDELTMPPNASNWFAGCPQGSPGVSYDPDCLSGITVTIIQDGNTLSGEAIGGTGNYTYAWYVDNVLVGTGNEIDILITGDYILVATDENGCQGASTTGQFVSMDEIAFQSIQISPNPATRLAVVQLHQISNGIASLVDLRGKIVWSMNFNTSRIEVPRGQLAAGVYSLRIETKEEILQLQFVFE
jgi:hypothetical protein